MAKKKKDFNYPDEDAPEHVTEDFFHEPFTRSNRRYSNIELLTPEKRESKERKEINEALTYNRPLPSHIRGIIEKANREETGERNKDIELPNEEPTIKIEITPKRKKSVASY